jgi:hypothetical protein
MMSNIQNSYYPVNLSYLVKKISAYSRRTCKLMPISANSQVTPGSIIQVDLPSNSIIDIDSFQMFFKASSSITQPGATVTAYSRLPPLIETLIERIAIEVNGVSLQNDTPNLNLLFTALSDMQNSVPSMIRRNILNGNNHDENEPAKADTETQYSISTFLGLFNSLRYLDSSLAGNVRLRLTLSPPTVCSTSTMDPVTYVMNDIFFSCDVISIDDGIFYRMHSDFLNKGGVYSIPFKNYMCFTNSSSSLSQSTNFSISTQSLDRLISFFGPGKAAKGASNGLYNSVTKRSTYFNRMAKGDQAFGGTTVTSALLNTQYLIGNETHPGYLVTPQQSFGLIDGSFGRTNCTIQGINKNITNLDVFTSDFWLTTVKLNHASEDMGVSEVSGIDSRGNVLNLSFNSVGDLTNLGNVISYTFAETTAILQIAAGRQVSIIY